MIALVELETKPFMVCSGARTCACQGCTAALRGGHAASPQELLVCCTSGQPQVRILENWFMRGTFYALYGPVLHLLRSFSGLVPHVLAPSNGLSVGFFSIDLDIDESAMGLVQGSVALIIVACGLLYSLMVRLLQPSARAQIESRRDPPPAQGLTCQKRVKELMAVEYKMMKRGLLGTPQKRPYVPVSTQPPR